jgi:hypothetical protein
MKGDSGRLRDWVQQHLRRRELPTFNEALEGEHYHISRNDAPDPIIRHPAAIKEVSKIRPPVYLQPRLYTGHGERPRPAAGSKSADAEHARRNKERELFQDLSMYYVLEEGQSAWARRQLLLRGEHEHNHSAR